MKSVLSHVSLVLAQSDEHRNRFIEIGMDPARTISTGNIKYFREVENQIGDKEKIVTFGSVKEKELHDVYSSVRTIKNAFPDYLIYIAPRELHLTSAIEKELSSSLKVARFSALKTKPDSQADVIVVDTVGDLLGIYRKSAVAFVGGSLAPYGGQNILEPLFFATPVLFGPSMENFKEIAETVIRCKAGIMVRSAQELTAKITSLLNNDRLRQAIGQNAALVMSEQKEAMEKTVNYILSTIKTAN